MKVFVRVDGSGRVVSGSNINRKTMPKVGKWKEIPLTLCCDYTPSNLNSILITNDIGEINPCIQDTFINTIYFNLFEIGSPIYTNPAGTILIEDGNYAWTNGLYILYFTTVSGIITAEEFCGK